MPMKVDKTLKNRALQGILREENIMIRVLFVCHGNSKVSIFGVAF